MLTETTLWLLLLFILLAPPISALVLRIGQRFIGAVGIAVGMTGILIGVAAAIFTISRNPLPPLRIGDLTLLPAWVPPVTDSLDQELLPIMPTMPVVPTMTPRPTLTVTATRTPEPTPTAEPTPTVEPTPTAEPTATPEPPATPTAAGPRRYTVQAGDTLRIIAERFGVTIEAILQANNLTPAQGDNLQVGQELVIP